MPYIFIGLILEIIYRLIMTPVMFIISGFEGVIEVWK